MKNLTFLTLIALTLSSCATIFTGTKDTLSFNTKPEGATIYLDGLELCKTPCRVPVKRSINDTDIEIKLDGYDTRVITLDKELNLVSIINLGNLLGWGIDALTGSVMKYDRKSYDVELKKDKSSSMMRPFKIDINTADNTVDLYINDKQ